MYKKGHLVFDPVNPTFTPVCSVTVIQNVNKAQVKVRAKKDNVAG